MSSDSGASTSSEFGKLWPVQLLWLFQHNAARSCAQDVSTQLGKMRLPKSRSIDMALSLCPTRGVNELPPSGFTFAIFLPHSLSSSSILHLLNIFRPSLLCTAAFHFQGRRHVPFPPFLLYTRWPLRSEEFDSVHRGCCTPTGAGHLALLLHYLQFLKIGEAHNSVWQDKVPLQVAWTQPRLMPGTSRP